MTREIRFAADLTGWGGAPVLAVDLGYSEKQASCGLAWTGGGPGEERQFGEAIEGSVRLLAAFDWRAVLVLEAVLSTRHLENGNPTPRGDFERGRAWYHGPGVATYAAAIRFVNELAPRIPAGVVVPLAEAFLSYKTGRTAHRDDARRIRDGFWATPAQTPHPDSEPIAAFIRGVPTVRKFGPGGVNP